DLDFAMMSRGIELAKRGIYTTAPNPNVGCVIVRDEEIVGEGYHHRAGEPHAEVHAMRMAGEKAVGATAYVTLEPCSHYGRTP
ncbi:bifunctional diaminohydroxyphosphoribosylaminopyrimidine deaminase/5-amino-6-(5-phosphoribosylamino)uracil reductase, partial [Vibrio parahaemolyticus]|nr:bifunctional diaminohydroxyphosphoribosylaminopyrimidine deaminase/5-amino-6-(5-phosphoribosylamino)uracil reductase [Vibrio parahaemolyticus]